MKCVTCIRNQCADIYSGMSMGDCKMNKATYCTKMVLSLEIVQIDKIFILKSGNFDG